jgi:small subunit ribosomal protein S8
MPRVANGLGITIVSTPKGVMADHAARERSMPLVLDPLWPVWW